MPPLTSSPCLLPRHASLTAHRPLHPHPAARAAEDADDDDALTLEFFVPPGSAPGVTTRKLLRGTLAKYLASLGVSFEATVTLEYAVPVPPPRAGPSADEDDWVAAIDGGERCGEEQRARVLEAGTGSARATWTAAALLCTLGRLHRESLHA
jgi:hypothetical protein